MENNFIMVKNNVVRANEGVSLFKKIDNSKIINVLCALDQMVNRLGYCCFSIEKLCSACGVKATKGYDRNNKPKSIEQIRQILIVLCEEGYILDINVDLEKVKVNEFIECVYNNNIKEKDKDGFFKLDIDTFFKINELKDNDSMLFYCYIKSMIGENNSYCYPESEIIYRDLGFDKDKVKRIVDKLSKIEVLFSDNIGQVVTSDGCRNATNVYVLDKNDLEGALLSSKQYYQNEIGAKVLNKKQETKAQQLSMLKNTAKREINKGKKVSDKLQNKIDKLSEELDNNCPLNRTEALTEIDTILEKLDLGVDAGQIAVAIGLNVYKAKDCNEILNILNDIKDDENKINKFMNDNFDNDLEVSDNVSTVPSMGLSDYSSKAKESDTEAKRPRRRGFGNPFADDNYNNEETDTNTDELEYMIDNVKVVTIEKKSNDIWNNSKLLSELESKVIEYNDYVGEREAIDMDEFISKFKNIKDETTLFKKLEIFYDSVEQAKIKYYEDAEYLELM